MSLCGILLRIHVASNYQAVKDVAASHETLINPLNVFTSSSNA